MSADAQKLGVNAQNSIGADGFGSQWIILIISLGINTYLYIVTKNKNVQQLDLSHRLDLSINVIFCLDVQANPSTIRLASNYVLYRDFESI